MVAKVAPYFEGCANPCNGMVESGSLLTFATICTSFLEAKCGALVGRVCKPCEQKWLPFWAELLGKLLYVIEIFLVACLIELHFGAPQLTQCN